MTDDNDFPADESDSDDETTVAGSTEGLIQSTVLPQGLNGEFADTTDAEAAAAEPTIEEGGQQQTSVTVEQVLMEQAGSTEEVSRAQSLTNHDHSEGSIIGGFQESGLIDAGWANSGSLDESRDNENASAEQESRIAIVPRDVAEGYSAPLVHDATSLDNATSVETTTNQYRPPAALSTTPVIPPAQAPSEVVEPLMNLDAEDYDEWQNGEYNFGDEPLDETWDTWGCLHRFIPLHNNKMHHYWLPTRRNTVAKAQIVKEVDCLRCYKTIILKEQTTEEKVETGRKDSGVELPCPDVRQASETQTTEGITASSAEPQQHSKKKGKNKKDTQTPKLFNCNQCGVVYCNSCKKATVKELIALRESNLVRD